MNENNDPGGETPEYLFKAGFEKLTSLQVLWLRVQANELKVSCEHLLVGIIEEWLTRRPDDIRNEDIVADAFDYFIRTHHAEFMPIEDWDHSGS